MEHSHNHHNEHESHASSYFSLATVLAVLLALTGLTVFASRIEFPEHLHFLHIWLSIAIASVKATFVLWYFMHLKYEPSFLRYFFLIAIGILAIFIGFTLLDTSFR